MENFRLLRSPQFIIPLLQGYFRELSEETHSITSCSIERAFRPLASPPHVQSEASFSFLYKLQGVEKKANNAWVGRVYVKGVPKGQDPSISESDSSTLYSSEPRKVLHFPEFDLGLWLFPADPIMNQLPRLFDHNKVQSHFPLTALLEDASRPQAFTEFHIRPLNYLPEDRCTILYAFQLEHPAGQRTGTLVGKTFSDTRGKDLFRLMEQVWEHSCYDKDAFRVAKPLRYDEPIHMFWQELLLGTSVTQLLNHTNCQAISTSIAKGLAHLHQSSFSNFTTFFNRGSLPKTREMVEKLMHGVPSLQTPLQKVLSEFEKRLPGRTSPPLTPIHGSFRIKEIIMQEGQLGLFDFDNCTLGDPMRDLGTFLADLHRRGSESKLFSLLETQFLEAYRRFVPWEVPIDAVNWHFRTRLLEKAYWRLENKWFDPNLEKSLKKIIEQAQAGWVSGT